ncbi:hypothetical protein SLS58_009213 [Diplodia intermedia]|uniref:Uncharacterized protein n=1 Tax=Diplodia intermedia TaxID=856260 RepID=A0ABR3TE56_9PEZI
MANTSLLADLLVEKQEELEKLREEVERKDLLLMLNQQEIGVLHRRNARLESDLEAARRDLQRLKTFVERTLRKAKQRFHAVWMEGQKKLSYEKKSHFMRSVGQHSAEWVTRKLERFEAGDWEIREWYSSSAADAFNTTSGKMPPWSAPPKPFLTSSDFTIPLLGRRH